MSQPSKQLRFVDRPVVRAKPVPRAKWEEYKTELRSLYQRMTLDDLMVYMKNTYGFKPSKRQYIYQFEKWDSRKYNTSGRVPLQPQNASQCLQEPLSASAPTRNTFKPPIPPKRPKSMGSLQSRSSTRSSMDRPPAPPKKRQKIAQYIASRDPFADPVSNVGATPNPSQPHATSAMQSAPTVRRLASLGLQFASQGQPTQSEPHFSSNPIIPLHDVSSNSRDASKSLRPDAPRSSEDNDEWITIHEQDDTIPLVYTDFNDFRSKNNQTSRTPSSVSVSKSPRRFDSSRPVHTLPEEELVDMKMAAHFLRSLGFDSDAFELFTILLKQLKEPGSQPAWRRTSALISCARSAFYTSQVDIARNELFKILEEPRHSSTDAEHFIYRMLLAETYARSNENKNEDFLSEIAIGCELASDKMFDCLPDDHRSYDILMYHYLNKCLEYLNTFVKDSWDEGTIFTDKEHLQIRLLERIPGPFELRRGAMGNVCLRSCLQWCAQELRTTVKIPDGWKDLQSHDSHYMYWTDHIGLYCALWERWQFQRRDCFGGPLPPWMLQAEVSMGITAAELLSITCGLIMSAATPRLQSGDTSLIARARGGVQAVSRLPDKDLGCQFLDTYSLLGTLLESVPQRNYHDPVSFFATLINSTREREAFSDRARTFARSFIEHDFNIVLPTVQRDIQPSTRRDSQALSFLRSDHARMSMDSLASAITPFFAASTHSSELSAMRSLRDQIQQTTRRSIDHTVTLPSALARVQTMSELSQAMESSLSLSSSQEAANAAEDTSAAALRDLCDFFADWNMDPFTVQCDEIAECRRLNM